MSGAGREGQVVSAQTRGASKPNQESAKGWLGMLLGVRLYYAFYGPVLDGERAFEAKVQELCRELGERGKA